MQSNPWSNVQQRWTTSGFPFTIGLMVLLGLTSFLPLFSRNFYFGLKFVAPQSLQTPWTLLTYSGLGFPSIFILFTLGAFYFFCGSLERSWGTKAFSLFWISISVISALAIALGASVLKTPLEALYILPLAGAIVVWGLLNADERIGFFMLPLRGIHFVYIAIAYIVFGYIGNLAAVPFALVGCLAAFGWLKYGVTYQIQSWSDGLIPMSRPAPRMNNRGGNRPKLRLVPDKDKPLDDRFTLSSLNPLRWWQRREERRKFEKLMGGDD